MNGTGVKQFINLNNPVLMRTAELVPPPAGAVPS